MKKVGIVGSRKWPFPEMVIDYVRCLDSNTTVVTGGANGVDKIAENEAIRSGIDVIVHRPNREKYGNSCYAIRNQKIVDDSNKLKAFRYNNSKGTTMTIEMAKRKGIEVDIVDIYKNNQIGLFDK